MTSKTITNTTDSDGEAITITPADICKIPYGLEYAGISTVKIEGRLGYCLRASSEPLLEYVQYYFRDPYDIEELGDGTFVLPLDEDEVHDGFIATDGYGEPTSLPCHSVYFFDNGEVIGGPQDSGYIVDDSNNLGKLLVDYDDEFACLSEEQVNELMPVWCTPEAAGKGEPEGYISW